MKVLPLLDKLPSYILRLLILSLDEIILLMAERVGEKAFKRSTVETTTTLQKHH